jgi:Raf kinase inhibitor-like YbhB/YbcL family protein
MRPSLLAILMTAAFQLTSPTFRNNGPLPPELAYDKHGCTGLNRSPALAWNGTPQGTQSLALIMFDPDAAKGRGWTHWVAYGMAPTMTSLPAGLAPTATGIVGGKNSFGDTGYDGPCPPRGDPPHHYVFTIYALDLAPNALSAGLDRDGLLQAMKGHTLGTAELTGLFARP